MQEHIRSIPLEKTLRLPSSVCANSVIHGEKNGEEIKRKREEMKTVLKNLQES